MQQYTNAQILAAVLERFLQPMVTPLLGMKLKSAPWMQIAENKVKSWGIAPPNWSLAGEITSFLEPAAVNMITPALEQQLAGIPDSAIPAMAHSVIDKAIENGRLDILGGFFQFEESDLRELKKLLDWNLPLPPQGEHYVVRTSAPSAQPENPEPSAEEITDQPVQPTNKKEKP